jgi:hypothetical protein
MARCKNCGKANRDGALFCQDCGRSVGSQASALVGGPAGAVAGSVGSTAAGAAIPAWLNLSSALRAAVCCPHRSLAVCRRINSHDDRLPGSAAGRQQATRPRARAAARSNPIAVSFCRSCGQNLNLQAPAADQDRLRALRSSDASGLYVLSALRQSDHPGELPIATSHLRAAPASRRKAPVRRKSCRSRPACAAGCRALEPSLRRATRAVCGVAWCSCGGMAATVK